MLTARVAAWHARPGDALRAGDALCDLATRSLLAADGGDAAAGEVVTLTLDVHEDACLARVLAPAGAQVQHSACVCCLALARACTSACCAAERKLHVAARSRVLMRPVLHLARAAAQELRVGAPLALLCEEAADVAALAAVEVYPPEARCARARRNTTALACLLATHRWHTTADALFDTTGRARRRGAVVAGQPGVWRRRAETRLPLRRAAAAEWRIPLRPCLPSKHAPPSCCFAAATAQLLRRYCWVAVSLSQHGCCWLQQCSKAATAAAVARARRVLLLHSRARPFKHAAHHAPVPAPAAWAAPACPPPLPARRGVVHGCSAVPRALADALLAAFHDLRVLSAVKGMLPTSSWFIRPSAWRAGRHRQSGQAQGWQAKKTRRSRVAKTWRSSATYCVAPLHSLNRARA
jgi:hypothetical protein